MWAVDRHKERERNIVKNDVSGLISRIMQHSNTTQQVIAELTFTTSGAPSGLGDVMIDDCRQALEQMSQALQELHACSASLDNLDIMMWVDDEQCR